MDDLDRRSPEERYLAKKASELATLESQLAERELELHTLRGGLVAFEAQYETVVGAKFTELDELRFQISQRTPVRVEPAEKPEAVERPGRTKATVGARRAAKGKPSHGPVPKPKTVTPAPGFNPTDSLKKLYRDVAKALHPDLADNETSRAIRHQYMIRVNEAYEAGNEEKLQAVLRDWEHSPEAVQGSGAAAELVRVIRKIDRCEVRLVTLAGEIEQIQTSGVFGMMSMAGEAEQFERDLLMEMSDRLDTDIAAAKELLAGLPPLQPQEPSETPDATSLPGDHHEGM